MSGDYLAIVTARSGSKRLPEKNVLDLAGKPLFVWSVCAALECPAIKRTIVSTDSLRYQEIALEAGAECPWLRSEGLAQDQSTSADVVREVLDRLGSGIDGYSGLVLLQPTSPLRLPTDISAAIALFEARHASAVVSVSEAECPPAWMGQLPDNLCLDDFIQQQFKGKRSQDLGHWYRINGAQYVIGIDTFRRENGFMPAGTLAHVMPRERSIDIDTDFDLEVARALMARRARGTT